MIMLVTWPAFTLTSKESQEFNRLCSDSTSGYSGKATTISPEAGPLTVINLSSKNVIILLYNVWFSHDTLATRLHKRRTGRVMVRSVKKRLFGSELLSFSLHPKRRALLPTSDDAGQQKEGTALRL